MAELHEHAALLVVDVQVGSFEIPGNEIHRPHELISTISGLIAAARRRRVPVIYSRYCGPEGTPMAPGRPGNEIHPAITPAAEDRVVAKADSDGFLGSDLRDDLERLGVRTLFVCGLQSEFCVDATCRSAYALGYRVILVEDAHSTAPAGDLGAEQIIAHHNATLGRAYVSLRRSDDLFVGFGAATTRPGVRAKGV